MTNVPILYTMSPTKKKIYKIEKKTRGQLAIPVILGGGINGYGLVRSFSREKIVPLVISEKKDFVYYSKHTVELVLNDEHQSYLLEVLHNIQKMLSPQKIIIIPTTDRYVEFIGDNYNALNALFLVPQPNWNISQTLLKKSLLYEVAERIKVKFPKTVVVHSIEEAATIDEKLDYPILLKPSLQAGFKNVIGWNVLIIDGKEMKERIVNQLANSDLKNNSFVFQEIIPGSPSSLYTFTSYSNRESEVLAYSVGRKIRQNPPDAGTIVSGKVDNNEEMVEMCKRMIKETDYYGFSNIEFKKDDRDGEFKLMEINIRPGIWNYSATASGVNLAKVMYDDLLNHKSSVVVNKKKEIVWANFIFDFYLAVFGFKARGYKKYGMGLWKWIKSVQGKKVDAIFNINDPLAGIMYLIGLIRRNKH